MAAGCLVRLLALGTVLLLVAPQARAALTLTATRNGTADLKVGDVAAIDLNLTSSIGTNSPVTLSSPSGANVNACTQVFDSGLTADITKTCQVTYSITYEDQEAGTTKDILLDANDTSNTETASATVSLPLVPRAPDFSVTLSGCTAAVTAPPIAEGATDGGTLSCTATVNNTGNMRLVTLAITGQTAAGCNNTGPLLPGDNYTCTVTSPITFTQLAAGSASMTVTGTAQLESNVTPAVSSFNGSATSAASTAVTVTGVRSLLFIDNKALTNVPVNVSGTPVTNTYTIRNAGHLPLTNIELTVSGTPTARVGLATVTCTNLTLDATTAGTLAPGSANDTCTLNFPFADVAAVEAGNVTFNISATATGLTTPVVAGPETVVVTNSPSLAVALNGANCVMPAAAVAPNPIVCTDALTLSNNGNVRIDIKNVTGNSTILATVYNCTPTFNSTTAATLAPGAIMTCSVKAATTVAGFEAGNATIQATATGVAARGTVTAIAGVTGGSVSAATTVALSPQPNVTFYIDRTKCAAPSPNNQPYPLVCRNGLWLTNTGNTRITVANITANASLGVTVANCTPALSASTPVTLAPAASLICSIRVATTQQQFDAGNVTFDAIATGISALGVNTVIPGVTNSSVTATGTADLKPEPKLETGIKRVVVDANNTLANVTTAGTAVRLQVLLKNMGNVQLNNAMFGGITGITWDCKTGFSTNNDTAVLSGGTSVDLTAASGVAIPVGQELICAGNYVFSQADLDNTYLATKWVFTPSGNASNANLTRSSSTTTSNTRGYTTTATVNLNKIVRFTVNASAVPGAVQKPGDTVAYSLDTVNQGNFALRNVTVATNLNSVILCDQTALEDGDLDVGESIACRGNITYDVNSLRNRSAQGNFTFRGNATALNISAVVAAPRTVVLPVCPVENRTVVPDKTSGRCLNISHCASSDGYTCGFDRSQDQWCTCWGGVTTCIPLGICTPTPCKSCQLCLADTTRANQNVSMYRVTDSGVAANLFYDRCKLSGGPESTCQPLSAAIAASFQGNMAKRSGLLCTLTGQCNATEPTIATGTCALASTGLVPAGNLSLCTINGTNTGARVPGGLVVAAGTNLTMDTCAPGVTDTSESQCTADKECGPNAISRRCICDPGTGADVCVEVRACQYTPCALCQRCFSGMRSFAASQAVVTDAAKLAAAFNATCSQAKYRSATMCSTVALQIRNSYNGNLGKRPGWLCSVAALGECNADVTDCVLLANNTGDGTNVTIQNINLCGIDGITEYSSVPGVQLPNVSYSSTSCVTAADCPDANQGCSLAAPTKFCKCNPDTGVDACTALGTCKATDCDGCNQCVQTLQPFVAAQALVNGSDAATKIAAAFATFCANAWKPAANCDTLRQAIAASPNGNIGKRAGLLCTLANACQSDMGNCTISLSLSNSTLDYTLSSAIDVCSVEGIQINNGDNPGGSPVPGIFLAPTQLPDGACRSDADCGSPDLQCDVTKVTGSACVCDAATGRDTCSLYNGCVRTPCKACSDCLAQMANFTTAQQNTLTRSALSTAFSKFCSAPSVNSWSAAQCSTVAARINASDTPLTYGKRAAWLCQALGTCNSTLVGGSCTLTINDTLSGSSINQCTLEGVPAGSNVPGASSSLSLPDGTCAVTADCNDPNKLCRLDQAVPFCTCSGGIDTCKRIGACINTPCRACNNCLQDFAEFVSLNQSVTDPGTLADNFFNTCSATGSRSSAACTTGRLGIASSFRGNRGKRAGAICQLLGECNSTALTGCSLTAGNGGTFNQCTREGVSSGVAVTNFPIGTIALSGSQCRSESDCTSGRTCNFDNPSQRCSCNATTGLDTCTQLGSCQPTPCSKCQICVSAMQTYINTIYPQATWTASSIASAFSSACIGAGYIAAACTDVRDRYITSVNYNENFGMRAGAVCTALGQCANLPTTCKFNGTTANATNAALDLCTAEGVVGGRVLKGVTTSTAIPTGRCLVDANCGTKQCDLTNTTTVTRCSNGRDNTTTYGTCVAKPSAPTGVSPCTRCSNCIAAARNFTDTALAADTTTLTDVQILAASFYSWCSATSTYSLSNCRDTQAAIAASRNGNLAKRAGALCLRLGECSATLSADEGCVMSFDKTNTTAASVSTSSRHLLQDDAAASSNDNTADNSADANGTDTNTSTTITTTPPKTPTVRGLLDACTIEGVSTGAQVPGTYTLGAGLPNNTCVLDSDCSTGQLCSSDNPATVCGCLGGIDTCDALNTCKNVTKSSLAQPRLTPCQACNQCIAALQPFVAANTGSIDSNAQASAFQQLCLANLTNGDQFACKDISNQIAFSYQGNLAKRAGALCARIRQCTPGGLPATCNITASDSLIDKLDLCTAEGVAGGTDITPPVTADNTTCRSDSDCAGANGTYDGTKVCSIPGDAAIQCSCANGTDICSRVGTCVSFCDTKQAYISQVNSRVVTCDPFSAAEQCGSGQQCTASSTCRKVVCDNAAGLATVPCYGLCVPTQRTVVGAALNNDGKSVSVSLNAPAADGSFACVSLFDTTTVSKIGADARCIVNGRQLTIQMGPSALLKPEVDSVAISPTQSVLVDALDPTAKFSGNSKVALCSSCIAPAAVIVGPKLISAPCDPSRASEVVLDASFSTDPSGRPLRKVRWTQQNSNDIVLAGAVDKANLANGGNGGYRLVIPAVGLADMDNGLYTVQATVTNYLNVSSTANFQFSKASAGTAPVISIIGGTTQTYRPSQGVVVRTQLDSTSVCPGSKVVYSWTSPDNWAALSANYNRKDLTIPPPVRGADGPHDVTLTARFDGSDQSTATTVTLVPQASPLQAVLKGPFGDVKQGRLITLDASQSVDPDDPGNASPFTISWSCTRADYPNPCFTGLNNGIQSGTNWTFKSSLLTPDIPHTFVVQVSKADGRTDYATTTATPRALSNNIATGRVRRICSSASCPARHNADQPLALSFVPDAGSDSASLQWKSDQLPSLGTGIDLRIPVTNLPQSGAVTVTAVASKAGSAGASSTQITVPINGKPTCPSGSCLTTTTVSNVFPNAAFRAEATGFQDDQPGLRYDFGVISATGSRQVLASSPAPTYTFTGLPIGTTRAYVCAVDAYGAQTCQEQQVIVVAPPVDFKIADALTNFNVVQLTGTGDVSVLASGAKLLQSLSSFASSSVAGQQTAVEKKAVQSAIAAKAGALINTLANNSVTYIDDSLAMSQIVSAVATLSKATTQLSNDTKSKMLEVAKAGVTATKLAKKPLSPDEASRLFAIVATGSGAGQVNTNAAGANSTASAGASGRRLLFQQELPDWLEAEPLAATSGVWTAGSSSHSSRAVLATSEAGSKQAAVLEVAATTSTAPCSGRRLWQDQAADNDAAAASDNSTAANDTASASDNSTIAASANASSQSAEAAPFVPAFAGAVSDIAELLAAGATPATGYLSGGDNGLYVSVGNLLGKSYPGTVIAVGPSLESAGGSASTTAGDNTKVVFNGQPLRGACQDPDNNPTSGNCSDVPVLVTVTYVQDASTVQAPSSASATPPAAAPPSDFTVVSGGVILEVSGDNTGPFPCNGCTATVSIPIYEDKNASQWYRCSRVIDGQLTLDKADATAADVATSAGGQPSVACTVNKAGTYLIGKTLNTNAPAGGQGEYDNLTSSGAIALGKPLRFGLSFNVNPTFRFSDFINNQTQVDNFTAAVKQQLLTSFASSTNANLTESDITISNIREGSILMDVSINTSKIANINELERVAGKVLYQTDSIFSSSFKSNYGVTGVSASLLPDLGSGASGLNIPAIVGGVVGGISGAALIAGIVALIIRRRRRAGVEPRSDRQPLANSEDV